MKQIYYEAMKIYRAALKKTFLVLLIGYAIGAFTNIYPISSFRILIIIVIIYSIYIVIDVVKADKSFSENAFEKLLQKPDLYATEIVSEANDCLLVMGQVIEVMPHPKLNKQAKITDIGWQLKQVYILDKQIPFSREITMDNNGITDINEINHDEDKYSLVGLRGGLSDAPDLFLDVSISKFSTIMTVQHAIKDNIKLREKYGNLEPEKNKIPHSLCLHFIVRFSDGSVLCLKRDSRLAYSPDLWSFSGEEQLSGSDFESVEVIESLFRRAICEEVLPLMGSDTNSWSYALKIIDSMRLWSIFIEERIFNYSLLGFYQLKLNKQEFVNYYKELISKDIGVRDKEGKLFIITEANLKRLLYEGKAVVESLFKSEEVTVSEKDLHPSSRYRIFRLLKGVRRGVLTEDYFR